MKPRMRFWNGYWWCRDIPHGITGQGLTMRQAYEDMKLLYREFWNEYSAFSPKNINKPLISYRGG